MDIFNKFFNEMTDGYFLEIGNFSNDPDNLIHKLYSSYRWHGVCMVKDTLNVNTQDTYPHVTITTETNIKSALTNANHSGLIHYLSIKEQTCHDQLESFITQEYDDPFSTMTNVWVRRILFADVLFMNDTDKQSFISLFKRLDMIPINISDNKIYFVHVIYKDLL